MACAKQLMLCTEVKSLLHRFSCPYPMLAWHDRSEQVNLTKERPARQPVGILVPRLDVIKSFLDIKEHTEKLVDWLLSTHRLSLLLKVKENAPDWALPAVSAGFIGIIANFRSHLWHLPGSAQHIMPVVQTLRQKHQPLQLSRSTHPLETSCWCSTTLRSSQGKIKPIRAQLFV